MSDGTGQNSIIIKGSTVTTTTAAGQDATATAIGTGAKADNQSSFAAGTNAKATNNNAVSIGTNLPPHWAMVQKPSTTKPPPSA